MKNIILFLTASLVNITLASTNLDSYLDDHIQDIRNNIISQIEQKLENQFGGTTLKDTNTNEIINRIVPPQEELKTTIKAAIKLATHNDKTVTVSTNTQKKSFLRKALNFVGYSIITVGTLYSINYYTGGIITNTISTFKDTFIDFISKKGHFVREILAERFYNVSTSLSQAFNNTLSSVEMYLAEQFNSTFAFLNFTEIKDYIQQTTLETLPNHDIDPIMDTLTCPAKNISNLF